MSNNITSIGTNAFYNCESLTSISIPKSVTSFSEGSFEGCTSLNKINYLGNVDDWVNINFQTPSSNPTYKIKDLYINGELLTDVKIESANIINDYAFINCESIQTVEIGNNVTEIGEEAFSGCNALVSIILPYSLNIIHKSIFDKCYNLKTIYNCSELDIVAAGVAPIIESPGEGKTTLVVYIPNSDCEDAIPYAIGNMPGDGEWRNQENLKMTRCEGKKEWWQVTTDALTPQNCKNFKFRMDDGNEGWQYEPVETYLEFDSKFLAVKNDEIRNLFVVSDCSDKVLYIKCGEWSTPCEENNEKYYFDVEKVIKGRPVGDFIVNKYDVIIDYIGDKDIEKIEIPEVVKGIEKDIFVELSQIDTIIWNAINCSDFLTAEDNPFYNISSSIKSFTFGSKVENIPAYLCNNMDSITQIIIPSSVTTIASNAFTDCDKLNKITTYASIVPSASELSFNNYLAELYVPCDVYNDYLYNDVFGDFTHIKCITANEVVTSDSAEVEVANDNSVTVIWPSTDGADSYELTISKDNEQICSLIFDAHGQLNSIDFGKRSANIGFQFTINGLEASSKYNYSVVSLNDDGEEIENYTGVFATCGYEGSLDEEGDGNNDDFTSSIDDVKEVAKVTLAKGLITCTESNFIIYNSIGLDVTLLNGSLNPGVYVVQVGEDLVKVMVK